MLGLVTEDQFDDVMDRFMKEVNNSLTNMKEYNHRLESKVEKLESELADVQRKVAILSNLVEKFLNK